jgi:4-amino-4-deoxy-L-arabinose transferase-like glycosyltransferase
VDRGHGRGLPLGAVRGGAAAVRAAVSSWCEPAWGAIALTAGFVALTCWWLTQDRSIPVYDAGEHLWTTIYFHNLIQSGRLLEPFDYNSQYPPLGELVGSLSAFVGGVDVASPIVGENLVFVPLLALGCYRTGRLLFTPAAGLLAAACALGSPLLIAQFHVFMLDAPETAMVAVSIWLLLESRGFSRVGMSALAGLAVAAGLLVKVQFPFFILGIVLCALLLGGWRNRRGFLTFCAVVVVLGSPWYLDHLSELSTISQLAGAESGATSGNLPTIVSIHNLTWYLWSILDDQLLVPLFALLAGGLLWTAVMLARRHGDRLDARSEFLVGGIVAWLAISLTPHHDIRYGMPLLPYLAVMATGWIVYLPLLARRVAVGVLVLGVALNTAGTTFGAGGQASIPIPRSISATYVLPASFVLYSSHGFLVSGPRRDGDVPGLFEALRRNGVSAVDWSLEEGAGPGFSSAGLYALALIAELSPAATEGVQFSKSSVVATLIDKPVPAHGPPPCTTLGDGTGVYVVRANPASGARTLYCPYRHPAFY